MDYSAGAYVLFPWLACLIFAQDFMNILRATPSNTIVAVFLLGAFYGRRLFSQPYWDLSGRNGKEYHRKYTLLCLYP